MKRKRIIFLLTLMIFSLASAARESMLLPPMGKRIDGLQISVQGPNCWNAALLKAGLNHSLRFTPKAEYWFWMTSPYCRALSVNERPRLGDLGSLFWSGHGHYHSFVYLNDQWVFSKNSPDPKYTYEVQRFEKMFQPAAERVGRNCGATTNRRMNSNCPYKVIFHRCQPLEKDFFENDAEIKKWDEQLKQIEEQIFAWAIASKQVSISSYEAIIKHLYQLLVAVKERKNVTPDKLKKFRLVALEYRILGLMLADIDGARKAPAVQSLINYAYRVQLHKKKTILLNSY